MYGEEGNDEMWSSYGNEAEYLWGGAGHDLMYGASTTGRSYLFGNEGDDRIIPGSYGDDSSLSAPNLDYDSEIRGGKGNDIINPMRADNSAAIGVPVPDTERALALDTHGAYQTYGVNWKGGPGEDTIWGPFDPYGDVKLYGN